jgi:serine/threonine-protein phosphatase 2A regulatory subunit B'
MKLFMEINPQLFDDCSHDYTEHQNSAEAREQNRRNKWDKLDQLAKSRKSGTVPSAPLIVGSKPPADGLSRVEEIDPVTQDSQQRLNALKLQDESGTSKERRLREREGQNSVSVSQVD